MLSHTDLYLVFIISFWFLPESMAARACVMTVLRLTSNRHILLEEGLAKPLKVKVPGSYSPV